MHVQILLFSTFYLRIITLQSRENEAQCVELLYFASVLILWKFSDIFCILFSDSLNRGTACCGTAAVTGGFTGIFLFLHLLGIAYSME